MNFLSPRFNGSLIIKMYEHISVRRLICQHHKMEGKQEKICIRKRRERERDRKKRISSKS